MGVRISLPVPLKIEIMAKFRDYIDEVGKELVQKVSWPTWKQLQELSMIVLGSSVVIALMVLVMDLGTGWILDLVYSFFR
jgi:preprotein translocase subunit SecE